MITDPRFLGGELSSLEQKLLDFSPLRQYQDFTITLPSTANTPFDVPHSLNTSDPDKVRWEVIQMPYPLIVYKSSDDVSGAQFLRLRATSGGVSIRLRLTLDDGDTVENPPNATPSFEIPGYGGYPVQLGARTVPGQSYQNALQFNAPGVSSPPSQRSLGLTSPPGGGSLGSELNFVDFNNATTDGRLIRFRYTGFDYEFGPHNTGAALYRALSGTGYVNLGSIKDNANDGRWDYVYAQTGDFKTAIYERARTTALGEWVDYTPTWSTGGTLNNGTLTGRYTLIGKTCHYELRLDVGSTTTFSAAAFLFTLPLTKRNDTYAAMNRGGWYALDSSATAHYQGQCLANTTQVQPVIGSGSGGALTSAMTNVVPFAWATSDALIITGSYEIA
jgi:hypothetical protein